MPSIRDLLLGQLKTDILEIAHMYPEDRVAFEAALRMYVAARNIDPETVADILWDLAMDNIKFDPTEVRL